MRTRQWINIFGAIQQISGSALGLIRKSGFESRITLCDILACSRASRCFLRSHLSPVIITACLLPHLYSPRQLQIEKHVQINNKKYYHNTTFFMHIHSDSSLRSLHRIDKFHQTYGVYEQAVSAERSQNIHHVDLSL